MIPPWDIIRSGNLLVNLLRIALRARLRDDGHAQCPVDYEEYETGSTRPTKISKLIKLSKIENLDANIHLLVLGGTKADAICKWHQIYTCVFDFSIFTSYYIW